MDFDPGFWDSRGDERHVDPTRRGSGAMLSALPPGRRTAGDAVMAWVAPLHVGNFGGRA